MPLEHLANGAGDEYEFPSVVMRKFWNWMEVMVTQQCECSEGHKTVPCKMVTMVKFALCLFFTKCKNYRAGPFGIIKSRSLKDVSFIIMVGL